ncbi:membrane protein insertase YidC [Tenacibaculum maritimum]|uniref:membrane protein insertase YidC n=1 Tax=Tenacibaculum maritimum TaxID=107401 RepID=UPI0004249BF8|nr:membrane protein insertase YidC [Tenacibaculum maritimum]MCD9561818.1 membrane protein insertase YidC [Tenacibaculum maritimum]MCD9566704.1 membrane protein insertase YidC [Tenacibaculum maritimum]MCD9578654.1 membrane protein insertase YidC [Tenacibaculum maritimum]MCD9596498.1 membrane protein insertase YidC [Tenacibaculum maritimum]MCD9609890.1 membrane protein insertase YidC [Tenacibaculum maritimum]
MEEKKFDFNSLIGMILLGAIMFWYMSSQKPEVQPENTTNQEIIDSTKISSTPTERINTNIQNDSLQQLALKSKLGAFAHSAIKGKEGTTTLENEVLKLTISNKGGQITEALVKNYFTYDKLPLYLIKGNNASFNINFGTTDNRVLNTKELFFEPSLTKNGTLTVLSMKLKVSDSKFLEYRYEMSHDQYMVNFAVRSQGLGNIINTSQQINLDWKLEAYRHEKSQQTENMYSTYYYKADDEVEYLSPKDSENVNDVNWVAFKQHFFSSILLTDTPFNNATLISQDFKGEEIDSVFTKTYSLKTPLVVNNGELNYNMKWYYGPTNYNLLKTYAKTDLDEIVDLGWGIFGFLNRTIFYPVFNLLKGFMSNYGLIIILMTIVVRILMSPLVYKSYLSSAKMKVIKPEMQEVNDKYPGKENAMKRQQEIMAIQRKAGVSMMSGCIPALLQMPIFFALFRFFPSNIELRQKGFLWATDLSSYDTIFKLPFKIPFYGDHVSLFPILASIAIFFYMKMNQSQQANMQQPTQEGMPDMSQMMKYMIYFSPLMMLFFFNNYASGLSLYYFVSNLLTIAIMLVIKHYVIDEKKIHAQIEENKKKPEKAKSKFRQRLDEAMKQAQEQQAAQQRRRK